MLNFAVLISIQIKYIIKEMSITKVNFLDINKKINQCFTNYI